MYIYIYIHTYMHTYIHTYIHTYTHTYRQTDIHTYIHTHIHIYIYITGSNSFQIYVELGGEEEIQVRGVRESNSVFRYSMLISVMADPT